MAHTLPATPMRCPRHRPGSRRRNIGMWLRQSLAAAMLLLACVLRAQGDFYTASREGQMLCFQILADSATVRLTHPEREWPYYGPGKPKGVLTVPAEVQWQGRSFRVVEVGSNAFYRCDSLRQVVLPPVVRIGAQAFNGCISLEAIDLPSSLREVGEGAFAYCRSLRTLELPPAVVRIGISAFAMCEGLRRVRMTEAAERLCDPLTFHGCPLFQEPKNRKNDAPDSLIWTSEPL
ncbi:MAG: leucine-rich repeat domain-containing protein [Bacteroidales bacterium]|nr:leucine-rich repeat domain-containing protein [Bacteroidales bacterium]